MGDLTDRTGVSAPRWMVSVAGGDQAEFDALFPDYVVECDEHLTAAGRVLLDIEHDAERISREQLDALFRSFHSIKGLSGMVGLHEAERLAHHLETYLGAVRKGRATLIAEGVQ